ALDEVRRLGNEPEAGRRDFSAADDAASVLTAVQATEGLVDEADASLEHRLSGEVDLPRLGLAGDIRGVLIGEGDVPAALALRHGEPLLHAFDRCREVRALMLEPLAHRIWVHVASVRQNWPVLPADVSKRRSDLHLLDVREQDEWDAGHIEGAQHIPLGELGARL